MFRVWAAARPGSLPPAGQRTSDHDAEARSSPKAHLDGRQHRADRGPLDPHAADQHCAPVLGFVIHAPYASSDVWCPPKLAKRISHEPRNRVHSTRSQALTVSPRLTGGGDNAQANIGSYPDAQPDAEVSSCSPRVDVVGASFRLGSRLACGRPLRRGRPRGADRGTEQRCQDSNLPTADPETDHVARSRHNVSV